MEVDYFMATPMTSSQIVAQLKKWGIKYKEVKTWETHNRAGHGAWGGMNGFIWHHTGADVKDAAEYAGSTLYNGLSTLPGPLCHFGLAPDGTVYLVGWGRANHAGGGDPAVLNHVINEDYSGQLHPTKGNLDGVDGNAHFYGVEIMYSGNHKMTDAQYKTGLKLSAAILDFHKWTEKSVIGHGEWSDDKWDPGYAPGKIMDMTDVRKDVAATLKAGPSGSTPTPTPTPKPTPTPTSGTYTVVKGDTLWKISEKYNVTVSELKTWNSLKSDELSVGQVLKVKKPAAPAPAPKPKTTEERLADLEKRVTALEKK
jgi:LysM repeat protein